MVELETLIGHTTAIGSATRESGNIVGNSLKSIYARITTNDSAISALDAINVSMTKIDGSSKNSQELIEELAGRWDGLSDAQRRNTAVGVAGIYQLSRFNALLNNYDLAVDATTTALNSQGSAMREQEKYNESLEARINRLSTAWYSFANTLGQNGLYDTIVVGTKALEMMTQTAEGGLGIFNMYSASLGALGVGLTLLSTRFASTASAIGMLIKSKVTGTTATNQATIAQGRYTMALGSTNAVTRQLTISKTAYNAKLAGTTAATKAATVASATLATTMRSLMLATGVGAAFVVVGIALEKMISRMSEATQESEKIKAQLDKNVSALTDNKHEVNGLIDEYTALTIAKKENADAWDSTKEQEYLSVQQRLGDMFPSLIDYIDSTGQSHLKTGQDIEKEIALTKQLIEAKKEETRVNAIDSIDDQLKENKKLQDNIKKTKDLIDTTNGKIAKDSWTINTEQATKDVAELGVKVQEFEIGLADSTAKITSNILTISQAFTTVDIDGAVSNNIEAFVRSLDFSNMDATQLKVFASALGEVTQDMQNAFNVNSTSGLENANSKLNQLASTTNNFDSQTNSAKISMKDLEDAASSMGKGVGSVTNEMDALGESVKDVVNPIDDISKNISYLNGVLEDYRENNELSASSILELTDKYPQLIGYIDDEAQLIKELTKIRDNDIDAAKAQLAEKLNANEQFYNNNLKALEQFVEQQYKFYDGDLKQFQNVAQAKADVEIQLINELAKKWGVYYNEQLKSFQAISDADENGVVNYTNSFGIDVSGTKAATKAQKELNDSMKAFNNFTLDRINLDFNSIGTSAEKAAKKTKESTKESIYITDKYKQKIEELTLAIEKLEALRNNVPTYSNTYISSLEKQLKLEQERLKVIQAQEKSVANQIKSGSIKQVGTVTEKTSSSKTSSVNSNGLWSSRISSGYGNRIRPNYGTKQFHGGIDLAAAGGTGINANVSGKVIASGSATKNGYDKSYGNIVVIQDDSGAKHLYAHLEKAIAKLGTTIQAGTKLGTVGSTGNSTGNHLHYGVKINGKWVDPSKYIADAKNNITTVTNATVSAVSNTQQSIDEAKSALNGLTSDAIRQKQIIEQLEAELITSYLSGYENRKQIIDDNFNHEVSKLKNVDRASSKYQATLNLMNDLLARKQKVNQEELKYVEDLIKKGGLSANTLAEMKYRTIALKTSIQDLNNEMGQLKFDQLSDKYEDYLGKQDETIAFESAKIKELDTNSERYVATLDKITKHLQRKHTTNQEEINDLNSMIKSGKYSGEVLESMTKKVQSLTVEMKNLAQEIANNNYEVVVNIRTKGNEIVDDLQHEMDLSKIFQGRYEEGSADANNEIKKQIGLYEQMAKVHDETRRNLQSELKTRNLLPEQIKEITELMEDESVAYNQALASIQSLNKEMEETNKRLRNQLADNFINAYKEVTQEMKDEHIKSLEDRLEVEEKASEKLKGIWKKEMDLFRDNINERLQLIDRTEAERSYNMEIDDLEKERKKLNDAYNLLLIDNSNEAKSKRKKLIEQIESMDKQLGETRHQRDIELQKQALGDMLEDKERDNTNREELEDERFNTVAKTIDREKQYWEKHYNDLLNDERKFAAIREDIMNGHFDKVASEFEGYMAQMQATMPQLADTMDGTMRAVGTAIRQNVIDNIKEAINAMREFEASQVAMNTFQDSFKANASKDTTYSGNTGNTQEKSNNQPQSETPVGKGQVYASLNKGDMQVLLGKYINDVIAPTYEAGTADRNNLKSEGHRIAALGRGNSSQIPTNSAFGNELSNLTSSQISQFKSFVASNTSILGGKYANKMTSKMASLDTGGYMNWSGSGVDGKGGKAIIAHPGEVMIDKVNTDGMIRAIPVIDSMTSRLSAMTSQMSSIFKSMIPSFANSNSTPNETFNFEFTGNIYAENKASINNMANQLMTDMKLKRGGR